MGAETLFRACRQMRPESPSCVDQTGINQLCNGCLVYLSSLSLQYAHPPTQDVTVCSDVTVYTNCTYALTT